MNAPSFWVGLALVSVVGVDAQPAPAAEAPAAPKTRADLDYEALWAAYRRQPENPEAWPSEISNKIDALVQAVDAVRSATLVEPASTEATSTGTLGVLAYLRRLTDLAVYSEA